MGTSALSPTSQAIGAGNNVNFKRGIAYRTTISGGTAKDRRTNAVPGRAGTFTVPSDANDVSSISHGTGGGGRGLSFFDKLTSKFSRRYVHLFHFYSAISVLHLFNVSDRYIIVLIDNINLLP